MHEYPTDQQIMARIQTGDMSACDICIEKHQPFLRKVAIGILNNEADADDVVQETFLNAFKSIDSFEGRSSLATWLYRITYNNALIRLRRSHSDLVSVDYALQGAESGKIVPPEFYDWCCLPEEDFSNSEIREQLDEAFKTLSPGLRRVFVYRELRGMSTRETAESLEISEDAVKTRLKRARKQLRQKMSPYLSNESVVEA